MQQFKSINKQPQQQQQQQHQQPTTYTNIYTRSFIYYITAKKKEREKRKALHLYCFIRFVAVIVC